MKPVVVMPRGYEHAQRKVADFVRGYYGGMTPMPSGEVPMLTFAQLLAAAGRHESR